MCGCRTIGQPDRGNAGSGVALAFRMDGSRDVQVNGNKVRNNAGKGIEVADGVEAQLSGNVLRDNGK